MPSGDEGSSTILVPYLRFKTYETALEIKGKKQNRFFFFFSWLKDLLMACILYQIQLLLRFEE